MNTICSRHTPYVARRWGKAPSFCALLLAGALWLPIGIRAAGVTIITHGWNPSGAAPAWMASLRNDIANNFLGGAQNYGTITVTKPAGSLVATCSPWNVDLSAGTNGEILILLDWSSVANHLTGGPSAQAVAAAVIDKLVTGQNGNRALAELPIHLIGHSRGGGMVCELARLLGERGLVVDQLTPLDPHPLTASDPQPPFPSSAVIDTPAAIYQNVVFADVYSQTGEYPTGQSLPGGYNRQWSALPGGYYNNSSPNNAYAAHRNILLLYQGTVNLANPLNNGEATLGATERAAWFNAYENNGDTAGFTYSRLDGAGHWTSTNTPVAGGDAIRAGLNNAAVFGGGGSRSSLTWSAAVWPNVAQLDVLTNGTALGSGTCQITIGTTQQVRYVYLNYASGCTVTLRLDADRNPYNSNDIGVISTQVVASATGSAYAQTTVNWNTTGMTNGTTAYLCAQVTDGTRTRYFYAASALQFVGPPPEPLILTASAGAHGRLTPDGNVPVPPGGTTNFTITPDAYYHVADVTTNGVSVGAVTSFTWTNVTADGTVNVAFAADLSAKGTPHWWLAQNGWTNNFDAAEASDTDHDGFTAGQEYVADTNPTNAASYFHIISVANLPPLTVTFLSSSLRVYSLCCATNLSGAPWTVIAGQSNLAGTGGVMSLADTNRAAPFRSYRVKVALP